MITTRATSLVLLLTLCLLGCEPATEMPPGLVAVVDLQRIAEDTGVLAQLSQQMQARQQQANQQLQRELAGVEQEFNRLRQTVGDNPTPEQQQQLQQVQMQAQARIQQFSGQVQQELETMQRNASAAFRQRVRDHALAVARERGMTVVLIKGEGVLDHTAEAEITDAVLERMRTADGATAPIVPDTTPRGALPPGVAPPGTIAPVDPSPLPAPSAPQAPAGAGSAPRPGDGSMLSPVNPLEEFDAVPPLPDETATDAEAAHDAEGATDDDAASNGGPADGGAAGGP